MIETVLFPGREQTNFNNTAEKEKIMSKPKMLNLVWNAGKDAYAGNRLVQELGPMMAVQEMSKTLIKAKPTMSEFDAVNISSNVLQYQTMLAEGCMPCHATRQRVNTTQNRAARKEKPNNPGDIGESA